MLRQKSAIQVKTSLIHHSSNSYCLPLHLSLLSELGIRSSRAGSSTWCGCWTLISSQQQLGVSFPLISAAMFFYFLSDACNLEIYSVLVTVITDTLNLLLGILWGLLQTQLPGIEIFSTCLLISFIKHRRNINPSSSVGSFMNRCTISLPTEMLSWLLAVSCMDLAAVEERLEEGCEYLQSHTQSGFPFLASRELVPTAAIPADLFHTLVTSHSAGHAAIPHPEVSPVAVVLLVMLLIYDIIDRLVPLNRAPHLSVWQLCDGPWAKSSTFRCGEAWLPFLAWVCYEEDHSSLAFATGLGTNYFPLQSISTLPLEQLKPYLSSGCTLAEGQFSSTEPEVRPISEAGVISCCSCLSTDSTFCQPHQCLQH
ncbi:hypothetical protein EK904_004952 [Melospiza melodia maxima]|nr:hypothetical protein EK904_004952 [Melospiza melodia maxima]